MSRPVEINGVIRNAFVECQEEKCPAWSGEMNLCKKLAIVS
jgi:hypothetical protein